MKLLNPVRVMIFSCSVIAAGNAWSQDPIVLQFAHEAPENAIKGRTAEYFADKVDELSDGSLRIDVFAGASLISTTDEVRAAMRGQVDIIAPQTSYYVPFNAGWDVFYQPLLFDSAEQGMNMLAGELGRNLLNDLEKVGLKGLGIWHDGPGYLFVTDEPVTEIQDLSGMDIRLFPSAPLEQGIREAGGNPVSMPAPDVYMSLQQGLIEGVVTAVTYAAPARWYEVMKGGTRMTMFIGGYGVTVNKDRWEELSPEHQDILERAMVDAEAWNYEQAMKNIDDAEQTLQDNGMTLTNLSDEELTQWREAMKPVYENQPEEVRVLIESVQNEQ